MKIIFALLFLQAFVAFAAEEEEKEQREGRVFPGAWSLLDSLRPVRGSEAVEGTRRVGSILRRRVDTRRDEDTTDTNGDVKTKTEQAQVDTEDSTDQDSKPTRTLVGRRRSPPRSAGLATLEGKLLKERRILNRKTDSETEKGKSAYYPLDACSLVDCYYECGLFGDCWECCYSAYDGYYCSGGLLCY